jgi:hypothetical protein
VDRGQRLPDSERRGQRVSAIGNKRAETLEEPNPFSAMAEWSNPLGTTKRPWDDGERPRGPGVRAVARLRGGCYLNNNPVASFCACYLIPRHSRALGVGRRSRGEQGERDEQ